MQQKPISFCGKVSNGFIYFSIYLGVILIYRYTWLDHEFKDNIPSCLAFWGGSWPGGIILIGLNIITRRK